MILTLEGEMMSEQDRQARERFARQLCEKIEVPVDQREQVALIERLAAVARSLR